MEATQCLTLIVLGTRPSAENDNHMQSEACPLTNEAAVLHVKHAHLQTLIWCTAAKHDPPNVDVTKFGWDLEGNQKPCPIYGPATAAQAAVLQAVACSCKSDNPCATNRCNCRSAGLSCTTYYQCESEDMCGNSYTSVFEDSDSSDSN